MAPLATVTGTRREPAALRAVERVPQVLDVRHRRHDRPPHRQRVRGDRHRGTSRHRPSRTASREARRPVARRATRRRTRRRTPSRRRRRFRPAPATRHDQAQHAVRLRRRADGHAYAVRAPRRCRASSGGACFAGSDSPRTRRSRTARCRRGRATCSPAPSVVVVHEAAAEAVDDRRERLRAPPLPRRPRRHRASAQPRDERRRLRAATARRRRRRAPTGTPGFSPPTHARLAVAAFSSSASPVISRQVHGVDRARDEPVVADRRRRRPVAGRRHRRRPGPTEPRRSCPRSASVTPGGRTWNALRVDHVLVLRGGLASRPPPRTRGPGAAAGRATCGTSPRSAAACRRCGGPSSAGRTRRRRRAATAAARSSVALSPSTR